LKYLVEINLAKDVLKIENEFETLTNSGKESQRRIDTESTEFIRKFVLGLGR